MNDDPRRVNDQVILDLKTKVDQIYEILIGKGGPDAPGLVVRVALLEKSDEDREKRSEHAWQGKLAVWGVMGSLIVERVVHYLRK